VVLLLIWHCSSPVDAQDDECLFVTTLDSNIIVYSVNEDGSLAPFFRRPANVTLPGPIASSTTYTYVGGLRELSQLDSQNALQFVQHMRFSFPEQGIEFCSPSSIVVLEEIIYVGCTYAAPYGILAISKANFTVIGGQAIFKDVYSMTYFNGTLYFTAEDIYIYSTDVLDDGSFLPIREVPFNNSNFAFVPENSTLYFAAIDSKDDIIYGLINVDNSSFEFISNGYVVAIDMETMGVQEYSSPIAWSRSLTVNDKWIYIVEQIFLDIEPKIYLLPIDNMFERPKVMLNDSAVDSVFISLGPCSVIPVESEDDKKKSSDLLWLLYVLIAVLVSCMVVVCIAVIVIVIVFKKWTGRRKFLKVTSEESEPLGTHEGDFSYREIDPDDLELQKILGKGAFGKVYKGMWRGAVVAVKRFDIDLSDIEESALNEIRKEAHLMDKLGNHPNVISFVGAVTQPDSPFGLCLVLDYCPNGSLWDMLFKHQHSFPLHVQIRIMRDIANGILHLHKEGVIHRDIACRNVLVGNGLEVYISDFGMARLKDTENTTKSNIGPLRWMAPEAMTKREYSEASDVFSYGVTLWEMVTKLRPWGNMEPAAIVIAVSQKNTRLKIPNNCDPVVKKIIRSCWATRPSHRITFPEIVNTLSSHYDALMQIYGHEQDDSEYDYSEEDDGNNSYDALEIEDAMRASLSSNNMKNQVRKKKKASSESEKSEDVDLEDLGFVGSVELDSSSSDHDYVAL